MEKTKILKIKGDWQEVVDDCRETVGKPPLGSEPSKKFKRKILLSEHSPIRDIMIKWVWENMPHWVTVHWVRHKWEKFVRTQRTDRTGSEIPRGEHLQGEPQTFVGDANVQQLIDTMRKRLCWQASAETREYAEDLKAKIHEVEPEISDVLVPNCVYRCGCPEMTACPYAKEYGGTYFMHLNGLTGNDACSCNIQERYDAYNSVFWGDRNEKTAER